MGEGGYKQINKALNVSAFKDYLETQQAQLPKLDNVQQLSPRVIRILGQNPGKVQKSDFYSVSSTHLDATDNSTYSIVHLPRYQYLYRRDRQKEAHN
jgi:hypothetical protein